MTDPIMELAEELVDVWSDANEDIADTMGRLMEEHGEEIPEDKLPDYENEMAKKFATYLRSRLKQVGWCTAIDDEVLPGRIFGGEPCGDDWEPVYVIEKGGE